MEQILIIDDDALMRQMLAESLRNEFQVMTADDGIQGIDMAEKYHPDLIICDIAMPKMDGFNVFRQLQNSEKMVDVPFIFLSGMNDSSIIRQGMTLGADDFLTKPVHIDELQQVVHSRLEKRARRQKIATKTIEELRLNITMSLPHELRTAITIMEGFADLVLEDDHQIDPDQREMVKAIRDNAERLRHMAEKYLWYLKVCLPDKKNRDFETPNPDEIIQSKAFEIAQRFDRVADLDLVLETHRIHIRHDDLSRIVEEVIENAFKFSKVGTPVSVYGEVVNDSYRIKVTNLGRAMSPDQIEQIGAFMQFERAKYEQQGTGLGLTIVKHLAQLNKGALNIHSKEGQTMVVTALPLFVSDHTESPATTYQCKTRRVRMAALPS